MTFVDGNVRIEARLGVKEARLDLKTRPFRSKTVRSAAETSIFVRSRLEKRVGLDVSAS